MINDTNAIYILGDNEAKILEIQLELFKANAAWKSPQVEKDQMPKTFTFDVVIYVRHGMMSYSGIEHYKESNRLGNFNGVEVQDFRKPISLEEQIVQLEARIEALELQSIKF